MSGNITITSSRLVGNRYPSLVASSSTAQIRARLLDSIMSLCAFIGSTPSGTFLANREWREEQADSISIHMSPADQIILAAVFIRTFYYCSPPPNTIAVQSLAPRRPGFRKHWVRSNAVPLPLIHRCRLPAQTGPTLCIDLPRLAPLRCRSASLQTLKLWMYWN